MQVKDAIVLFQAVNDTILDFGIHTNKIRFIQNRPEHEFDKRNVVVEHHLKQSRIQNAKPVNESGNFVIVCWHSFSPFRRRKTPYTFLYDKKEEKGTKKMKKVNVSDFKEKHHT